MPCDVNLMIEIHDSGARWRSFLQEACANEVSRLASIWPEDTSLVIPFEMIQAWDPPFANLILDHPRSVIKHADSTLASICRESGSDATPHIRIESLPPDAGRKLRQISSEEVETFVTSEVIVTKVSELKPRIYQATFTCSTCGNTIANKQENELELIEPLECPENEGGCGRRRSGGQTRFNLQWESSEMIDNQWIEVQELPENVKAGSQPVRLSVLAERELAGKHVPGERIRVNGIPYVRTLKRGGQKTPMFDVYLSLHSSERKNIPLEEIQISEEELQQILELSQEEDLESLFIRSIAPTIIADERLSWVKHSLVYQLLGGVARKYTDGTRTRGDIHILLMGDPGVAKSQLLSFMGRISPRGRFTTGGGTSAAGLTAAAVRDAFNDGRFSLEAGALVLADMGLCAIDEFDKMSNEDRGAMHEAMEQQVININKGGVSATMPTRCAVLSAANPRSGRFDKTQFFMEQIDLPPPLVSRFDIIWILTDDVNMARDTRIGEHVIRAKRTGIAEHLIESGMDVDPRDIVSTEIYSLDTDGSKILTIDFLQKYVAHAKRSHHPESNDKVMKLIVDYYTTQRNQYRDTDDSVPLTARSIEACLRLAEARARLYLRDYVTEDDAERAIALDKLWRYQAFGEESDQIALETGVHKRTRSAERIILSVVRNLCRELGGECETHQIYNSADEQGIDEDTVDRVLSTLRNRGTLMSPRIDRWTFV
jgi:replicative DNA helicase Mcm